MNEIMLYLTVLLDGAASIHNISYGLTILLNYSCSNIMFCYNTVKINLPMRFSILVFVLYQTG